MKRFLRRNGLLLLAGLAGILVGALVAGGVVAMLMNQQAIVAVAPTPTPLPSPSDSAVKTVMDTLSGDCTACHLSPDGGVGTKPIPPIGHPLEGWTQCTSCHATNRLVETAPGHTGIHADQCQICHKSETVAGPMRPHGEMQKDCLSCHGSVAPLPDSMKNRSGNTCWLCHRASDKTAPQIPHPLAGNAECFTCHVAGKVGALPDNHATRMETTCTACHPLKDTTAPAAPHSLVGLEGKCAGCHGPGTTPQPLPGASAPGATADPAASPDPDDAPSPDPDDSPAPTGTQYPLVTPSPATSAAPGGTTAP